MGTVVHLKTAEKVRIVYTQNLRYLTNGEDNTRCVLVTFRVLDENLVPDEVSALLDMTPSHSQMKGDSRPRSPHIKTKNGAWFLDSDLPTFVELEGQISVLLDKFEGKEAVLRKLTHRGYEIGFSCTCGGPDPYDNSAHFSSELIARLHSMGVHVWITFMPGSVDAKRHEA